MLLSLTFVQLFYSQGTLEEANALLTEFEAQFSDMETNGQAGSETSGQPEDDQDTEPLDDGDSSLRTEGEGKCDPEEVVRDMGLDSQTETQRL